MNSREYYTREMTLGEATTEINKRRIRKCTNRGIVLHEAYCLLAKPEVNYTSLKITRIAEETL